MSKELCPKCYSEPKVGDGHKNRICDECGWQGNHTEVFTEYTVLNIELDKIWCDNNFNCRGTIIPIDVVDLAKDIEKNGLQFPIAVQPLSDVSVDVPDNRFDFRIVAGHRRYHAFRVLKKETIPAMIKVGLSEVQARLLNLGENLKRKALNILQEARAIERLRDLGLNRRQVGEELGVSTSWVQVRYNLLDLPQLVQEEAAAGFLNQQQIKELFSLEGKEQQFDAVKRIKNARLRGEKSVSVGKSTIQDPYKKKRQPHSSVQEMIGHLGNSIGYGLYTRTLAWANGEINGATLFTDIAKYAKENGIDYKIPSIGIGDQEEGE